MDEIHLRHFFDYRGGSVVGAASNSKEAAKSAFAFMITASCLPQGRIKGGATEAIAPGPPLQGGIP